MYGPVDGDRYTKVTTLQYSTVHRAVIIARYEQVEEKEDLRYICTIRYSSLAAILT